MNHLSSLLRTAVFALACLGSLPWAAAAEMDACCAPPAAPIEIKSQLEPLIDDYLIESMHGVALKLHEPHSTGTVFVFDQPWEGATSAYVTVLQDDGGYRMYYRGSSDPDYTLKSQLHPGEQIVPAHPQNACMAESADGILWTRPNLRVFDFNGSKDNNIVWVGMENFSPFKDANPAAPAAERYKAVGSDKIDDKPVLIALVSPDGIHWKKVRDKPIITDGKFDSLNIVFWDTYRKKYVAIYRDFFHGMRTIRYATSDDFLTWTPGTLGDFGDAPPAHLYTTSTVPYFRAPQIYFAMPRRFMPWKTYFAEMEATSPGVSDGLFMTSRDGVHWHRYEDAFIRPGPDERNWAHRANTPSRGIFPAGNGELAFYVERHYTFPSNQVERFTLRTDGFVSAHTGNAGGEFVTKPLIFTGGRLLLNYATAANGGIQIEIQDAQGRPIPGFYLEDSPHIFGDKIDQEIAWGHAKGQTDRNPLKHLAGMPVRLRFVMRDADVYAIQFK